MSIDKQMIEKILDADLKNIAKRAVKGIPLTAQQIARLEKGSSPDRGQIENGNWRSIKQNVVAAALNISRQTIIDWCDKGCPSIATDEGTRYDLREIMNWRIAFEVKKASSNPELAEQSSEQLERYRKIKADTAEFDLDVKKKKFMPEDDVCRMARHMAERVRAELQAIGKDLSVKLANSGTSDACEQLVTKAINNALVTLSRVRASDDEDATEEEEMSVE